MTPADGFLMLVLGMATILIGGLIVYFVINKVQDNEQDAKEKERRERIFGK
jgi:hypothetical protein|tara:strand:- start:1080 stop:1232 length:153 start_codon:yes stop_codon:yes gene_type:complete